MRHFRLGVFPRIPRDQLRPAFLDLAHALPQFGALIDVCIQELGTAVSEDYRGDRVAHPRWCSFTVPLTLRRESLILRTVVLENSDLIDYVEVELLSWILARLRIGSRVCGLPGLLP